MTPVELLRLTAAGHYPVSILWEMRRGMGRILRRRLSRPKPDPDDRPSIPLADLRDVLDGFGLEKTDTLLVHSGIGNLGVVNGGRKAVFNLLTEFVDPTRGNLLFPVFSFYPRMYDYLESAPCFDVRDAPSYMGSVTEYALKTNRGLRSIHPTHSVLAIGKDQEYLSREHHLDSAPFGSRSPLSRMLTLPNAKVLLLGVSTDAMTQIHVIEAIMGDKFPVRVFTEQVYSIQCLDWLGKCLTVKTRCHTPVVSLARETSRFDPLFRQERVIIHEVPLGQHRVTLIDANRFRDCLTRLAGEGRTVYGRV